MADFAFIDPGVLRDGELALLVAEQRPAQPEKEYVPEYRLGMYVGDERVGTLSFRAVSTPLLEQVSGHIGYDVDEAFRGHRYAERACRLILPLARQHGFRELVITCNPDNIASYRTCERLGADMTGIVEVPEGHEMREKGETHKRRYVLTL